MDLEANQNSFKCTMSYLKFMGKIFKKDYPYMILNQAQQVTLHKSFLEEMLRVNFSNLMDNFFNFSFSTIGHFSKLATRLLKLTKTLLSKFDCGNPTTKIEIKQKNPRFDMFLDVIYKNLNKSGLKMLIEVLEIAEIRGMGHTFNNIRQSFISNKFLA